MKTRPVDVLMVTGIMLGSLALGTSTSCGEIRVARQTYADPQPALVPQPDAAFRRNPLPSHGVVECDHRTVSEGIWYRPRFLGLRKSERCSPDPFHPRGLGHLFARPSTPCRIDYAPTPLRTLETDYGPHYFRRPPSPYCEHCTHCKCLGRSREECPECR